MHVTDTVFAEDPLAMDSDYHIYCEMNIADTVG